MNDRSASGSCVWPVIPPLPPRDGCDHPHVEHSTEHGSFAGREGYMLRRSRCAVCFHDAVQIVKCDD